MPERLEEGEGSGGVRVLAEASGIREALSGKVRPRHHGAADPGDSEPAGGRPSSAGYFVSALTAWSHRWRRRVRSADEPYFAKS